jgi:hypothetical protein
MEGIRLTRRTVEQDGNEAIHSLGHCALRAANSLW